MLLYLCTVNNSIHLRRCTFINSSNTSVGTYSPYIPTDYWLFVSSDKNGFVDHMYYYILQHF